MTASLFLPVMLNISASSVSRMVNSSCPFSPRSGSVAVRRPTSTPGAASSDTEKDHAPAGRKTESLTVSVLQLNADDDGSIWYQSMHFYTHFTTRFKGALTLFSESISTGCCNQWTDPDCLLMQFQSKNWATTVIVLSGKMNFKTQLKLVSHPIRWISSKRLEI